MLFPLSEPSPTATPVVTQGLPPSVPPIVFPLAIGCVIVLSSVELVGDLVPLVTVERKKKIKKTQSNT